MADAENGDGYSVVVEADAIVADAEAKFGRVDALEPSNVAGAGFGKAFEGVLDAAGDDTLKRGHFGQCRPGPRDLHLFESQLAHGFGVGNAFAAI